MASNKMKVCKHCGAEIAKSAKICPVCGGKNPKPIFKRVWFWLLVLVILFAVLGTTTHKLSDEATGMSEADFKAACEEFEYKDLMRNDADYVGKKIKVKGEVVQVVYESEDGTGESQYRVSTKPDEFDDGYFDDDIVLYFTRGDAPKLLEDDIVTIYGEVSGTESYTTVLGANVTVPVVTGAYIDIED